MAPSGDTPGVDTPGVGIATPSEPVDDRRWLLDATGLRRLVRLLVAEFDEVVGPVLESGVIRLRPIHSVDDLPIGVVDDQESGTYRTAFDGSASRFSYGVGPDSLKSIVHPPTTPVWTMRSRDGRLVVDAAAYAGRSRAVVGVRPCDLRALDVLERTQVVGAHPDPAFAARRRDLFLVAIDCTHPAATCCCEASGGPVAPPGFDLAMTETTDGAGVAYEVRAGTTRGADLLALLVPTPIDPAHRRRAEATRLAARDRLIREMPPDARTAVADPAHPRWTEVADRCLACGNCTAVCPTCFCTDLRDEVSLDGTTATRTRVWDTCFSGSYSALAGAPHRSSTMSRYRQWLGHKVGTWHEQFGESGCVGCGRCITWCPVGIDLTAELEALARPVEVTP